MEHVRELLKTSADEIRDLLSTKRVVGEPITIADCTVIPLFSLGFGLAGGGGFGKRGPGKVNGEGEGGGTGGGGGIKPVALIVIDPNGIRLEPVRGTFSTVAESLSEALVDVLRGRQAKGSGEGEERE